MSTSSTKRQNQPKCGDCKQTMFLDDIHPTCGKCRGSECDGRKISCSICQLWTQVQRDKLFLSLATKERKSHKKKTKETPTQKTEKVLLTSGQGDPRTDNMANQTGLTSEEGPVSSAISYQENIDDNLVTPVTETLLVLPADVVQSANQNESQLQTVQLNVTENYEAVIPESQILQENNETGHKSQKEKSKKWYYRYNRQSDESPTHTNPTPPPAAPATGDPSYFQNPYMMMGTNQINQPWVPPWSGPFPPFWMPWRQSGPGTGQHINQYQAYQPWAAAWAPPESRQDSVDPKSYQMNPDITTEFGSLSTHNISEGQTTSDKRSPSRYNSTNLKTSKSKLPDKKSFPTVTERTRRHSTIPDGHALISDRATEKREKYQQRSADVTYPAENQYSAPPTTHRDTTIPKMGSRRENLRSVVDTDFETSEHKSPNSLLFDDDVSDYQDDPTFEDTSEPDQMLSDKDDMYENESDEGEYEDLSGALSPSPSPELSPTEKIQAALDYAHTVGASVINQSQSKTEKDDDEEKDTLLPLAQKNAFVRKLLSEDYDWPKPETQFFTRAAALSDTKHAPFEDHKEHFPPSALQSSIMQQLTLQLQGRRVNKDKTTPSTYDPDTFRVNNSVPPPKAKKPRDYFQSQAKLFGKATAFPFEVAATKDTENLEAIGLSTNAPSVVSVPINTLKSWESSMKLWAVLLARSEWIQVTLQRMLSALLSEPGEMEESSQDKSSDIPKKIRALTQQEWTMMQALLRDGAKDVERMTPVALRTLAGLILTRRDAVIDALYESNTPEASTVDYHLLRVAPLFTPELFGGKHDERFARTVSGSRTKTQSRMAEAHALKEADRSYKRSYQRDTSYPERKRRRMTSSQYYDPQYTNRDMYKYQGDSYRNRYDSFRGRGSESIRGRRRESNKGRGNRPYSMSQSPHPTVTFKTQKPQRGRGYRRRSNRRP